MVRLSLTLPRMFVGRWALQSGRKVHEERWKDVQVETWQSQQQADPVCLKREARRSLWWFRDRFFWDDDGHGSEDVKALVLQRVRRDERRLRSAHALMRGERSGLVSREPIPQEVARAVIERDGRSCVQCGATENIQFDHILSVALGGATSVENLQILCSDCNQAKHDAL